MKLESLHHLALISSSYQKAMEFYRDFLGFEVISEKVRPDKQDILVFLKHQDFTLELFIKKEAPQRVSYPEALGLRHLAFKVDDVEQWKQACQQQGISHEDIRIDPLTKQKMMFIFDSDACPIELHE